MSIGSRFRFLLRACADFLFPPTCFGCEEEIEQGLICDACRLLLFTSELDVCPGCGRPCADAAAGCRRCRIPFCLTRVRALGLYRVPFHNLVHALKYSSKTALAGILGEALAALVEQDTELRQADVLCPIPLHPARMRERGYNQSLLLARAVAKNTGIGMAELLVRVRNTASQTAKRSDRDRLVNVGDAFRLKAGAAVGGLKVVLVDDVMTTGATLDAAGRQLLQAGARAVLGLVVAAAQHQQAVQPLRSGCPATPGTRRDRVA